MKIQRNVPKFIYVLCGLLGTAFWLVLFGSRMDDFAKTLYVFFLPLTATPYIMWVIHNEGQEPEEYFQKMYSGNVWLMWLVRIFMMVMASVLCSIAGIMIFGVIGLIAGLFW